MNMHACIMHGLKTVVYGCACGQQQCNMGWLGGTSVGQVYINSNDIPIWVWIFFRPQKPYTWYVSMYRQLQNPGKSLYVNFFPSKN
jgi:hypothetical protein